MMIVVLWFLHRLFGHMIPSVLIAEGMAVVIVHLKRVLPIYPSTVLGN